MTGQCAIVGGRKATYLPTCESSCPGYRPAPTALDSIPTESLRDVHQLNPGQQAAKAKMTADHAVIMDGHVLGELRRSRTPTACRWAGLVYRRYGLTVQQVTEAITRCF